MIPVMTNQIKALIQLLCSEENQTNTQLLRQRLMELGTECVPYLEEACDRSDSQERERIESVLQTIRWRDLEGQFKLWVSHGSDLEEGAFLLAEFCYPTLDVARYKEILDQMAKGIRPRLKSHKKSEEMVQILNQYFFHELGFHGNAINYYEPDNSYLNWVIDQRTGIPISLSVMMLLVSRRLGLPIVGVGLPGHFVVRYESHDPESHPGIYIDPFDRGRILTREECEKFIQDAGYGHREEYFRTATSTDILIRMMRNLIFLYNQRRETQKVQWLSRYVMALS